MRITVEGSSGKHHVVCFEGISSVESESPKGMMLYPLSEMGGESESLRRYEFVNWYGDEPSDERAKAYLRIVAKSFTVTAYWDPETGELSPAQERSVRSTAEELKRERAKFRSSVVWLCSPKPEPIPVLSSHKRAQLLKAGKLYWGRYPMIDRETENFVRYFLGLVAFWLI